MSVVRHNSRSSWAPPRTTAMAVAAALTLASCGGSSTADTAGYPVAGPVPTAATTTTATTTAPVPTTTVPATTAPATTVPTVCPFSGDRLDISGSAESAAAQSNADHVSGASVERSQGCGHLVIDLGTEFSFDIPGPPADFVAAGTTVSVVDNTLRVELAGVESLQFDDVDPDVGEGAVLARKAGTLRNLEIVVFPNGEFTEFSATFLDRPARVVVDFAERSSADGGVATPLLFDEVIVQSITRPSGYGVDPTDIVFTGFARPFEAQLAVEIIGFDGQRLPTECAEGCHVTGEAVEMLGVPTTDWSEAWGEFEFTLADLAPGNYTIRLSNDAGAVDSATWVEMPFVASP